MKRDKEKRLLLRNVVVSMLIQIMSLVINLISKRVICLYLNMEYLGLQSLYGNFCDVLSFAYFGMGTAMLFSFYGPMARGDKAKLATIYHHYNRLYGQLTKIVLAIGGVTTIFAMIAVNASISDLEVAITYLTYMLSVVLYNRCLVRNYYIQADQRRYFVAAVTGLVDVSALVIEVLVLKFFKSYGLFVLCILLKNLLINYILGWYLRRRYPYLFVVSKPMEEVEKNTIKANVMDMVVYRFGKVLISNTDSIFISGFISTAMVGVYSNYQFIIAGINSLISAFYEAITARVGQQLSLKQKGNPYTGFLFYTYINLWMTGATIVCFYFLVQDFIRLWMGPVELLSNHIVVLLIINYYLEICRSATKMYRESAGLFKNIKRMVLIKGGLNIVLSCVLGLSFGLAGILVATTISSAVTLFWYEPLIVYKYFNKAFINEVIYQLLTLVLMAVSFLLTSLVLSQVATGGIVWFLIRAAICGITANVAYVVFYWFIKNKLGKG